MQDREEQVVCSDVITSYRRLEHVPWPEEQSSGEAAQHAAGRTLDLAGRPARNARAGGHVA